MDTTATSADVCRMRAERPRQDRFSVLIAGTLSIALFAGAALANPTAFHRTVDRATSALFGEGPDDRDRRQGSGIDGDGSRRRARTPGRCAEIVDAFERAAPPSDDPRSITHAIEVVRANCARNPRAHGLIVALARQRANARKHFSNASGDRARGHGHGNAHRRSGVQAQGDGHGSGRRDASGRDNGH